MIKYGKPVPGSVRRGVIKGTNIENGSRYLQVMDCVSTLPNRTVFGRFPVRIFADNNRTQCQYCQGTDHPSYQCRMKSDTRRCFNCNQTGHLIKNCNNEPFCVYCKEKGHVKSRCEQLTLKNAKAQYGEYAHDILEGRECNVEQQRKEQSYNDEADDSQSIDHETVDSVRNVVDVILGASNAQRLGNISENIVNASVSGATFNTVDKCIFLARNKIDPLKTTVRNIVVCLGTNDVTRNRDDSDQVAIAFTKAMNIVENAFPESKIGVCAILPRKGKGQHITKLNETSSRVNSYIRKWCSNDRSFSYIDTVSEFVSEQGTVVRNLYDANDSNGIHVSLEGQQKLCLILEKYITSACEPTRIEYETPKVDRKRTRSNTTTTPSSAERPPNKQQVR